MKRTNEYQRTDIPCPWCDGVIYITPITDQTSPWGCLNCNSNFGTHHLEESKRSGSLYKKFVEQHGMVV